MASWNHIGLLTLLLASGASAQADETVWSSFAFILHGERTPLLGPGPGAGSLTTTGAQQLLSQGSSFRGRYLINGTLAGAQGNTTTTNAPIVGIEKIALDNNQLAIYTNTDDYVTGSALAFLQGLYPPVTSAFADDNGGMAASVLANGSLVNFPLGGYQYPNIQSMSLEEPNSVWLEGHVACTEYYKATNHLRSDLKLDQAYNATLEHYQNLWTTVFPGTYSLSNVNFDNAYALYDYASFQYNHNTTVRKSLSADDLNWIGHFASLQQFSKNGNLSVSGSQAGDMIRAISGRTLARKVLNQFQTQISSEGSSNKLTLMFGSYEPLLAFFSLSSLSYSHSSDLFQDIPQPGSALVFELFTVGSNISSYPTTGDLWVRFLFRNGTDAEDSLSEYPLFGRGYSESSMRYNDFVSWMGNIAVADLPTWCKLCGSPVFFCAALDPNETNGTSSPQSIVANKSYSLSPVVAGVIGAVTAVAVIALAVTSAAVIGGLRVHRADAGRNSSLGGFKGAEKMASDKDLSVAKSGAKHERVGSWELGGPNGPSPETLNKTTFGATRMRDIDDDGDSVIMERAPVKPLESV